MPFNVKKTRKISTWIPPALLPWIALAATSTVLQTLPIAMDWLPYERVPIGEGEWWRLLTGNLIHLGWGHLGLNVAGLLAIGWLFAEDYTVADWGLILLLSGFTTSIGLYLFTPEIAWCVGLSGALHGLFAAGAIAWLFDGVAAGAWLLAGGAAKIAYEQMFGAMPMSAETIGGGVVTDAHLWGAIGGVIGGIMIGVWRRKRPRL
jgi:rhomboid family GlyGly-CTERM serine protease